MNSSPGTNENAKLLENIQANSKRLLNQLKDLEDMKNDPDLYDEKEYEEMKKSTLEQIQEFDEFLKRNQGDSLTLIDKINEAKQKMKEAIGKVSNVSGLNDELTNKQPQILRKRLDDLYILHETKKIKPIDFDNEVFSILIKLKGTDKLSEKENELYKGFEGRALGELSEKSESNTAKGSLIDQATKEINKNI